MDKLDELIKDDGGGTGFEDLDTLFPPVDDKDPAPTRKKNAVARKEAPAEEESTESEPVAEAAPVKRRGRPPKKKEVAEEPVEAKPRKKPGPKPKVKVDSIPLEILDTIYNEYSTKPIDKLAKELDITPEAVEDVMSKLNELFQLNIASGDLTQEDYEKYIEPKMVQYQESGNFEIFVKSEIREIQKN